MAIEVHEIAIRMHVADEAAAVTSPKPAPSAVAADREALVTECVRRVLQNLNEAGSR